jgi:hypothetical protein
MRHRKAKPLGQVQRASGWGLRIEPTGGPDFDTVDLGFLWDYETSGDLGAHFIGWEDISAISFSTAGLWLLQAPDHGWITSTGPAPGSFHWKDVLFGEGAEVFLR